jgi:hypothetical protein
VDDQRSLNPTSRDDNATLHGEGNARLNLY